MRFVENSTFSARIVECFAFWWCGGCFEWVERGGEGSFGGCDGVCGVFFELRIWCMWNRSWSFSLSVTGGDSRQL